MVGASLVLLLNRNLGWLPNDDGTLMQTALRVGTGDLPHIDFHEPYTGGLGYLNAAALEIFGESMASLRWPFVAAAIAWIASLYLIGRRFMPPLAASILVSALALGSVLLHMSPIPSWYNLFLGTWSIHFAVKYVETDRTGFLLASGALVGLSTVLKTTGVYFGMAVWVIVLIALGSRRGRRGRMALLTLATLPIIASALVVSAEMTFARLVSLIVPIAIVVGLGIWLVTRSDDTVDEGPTYIQPIGLLLAAALIPLAAWAGPYAVQGYIDDLIVALLVVPSSFLDQLSLDNADPFFLLVPAAAMLSVRIVASSPRRQTWIAVILFLSGMGLLVWLARAAVLSWALVSVTSLGLVAAALFLAQFKKVDLAKPKDLALFALTCGSVFFGLIEFPHAGPYYYIYAMPLAAVAVTGWSFRFGLRHGYLALGLFVVLSLMFGANKLSGAWFADATTAVDRPHVSLQLERFGLRVPNHYEFYEPLVAEINQRISEGQKILAGPDAPEIYTLTIADNPTPILFELISHSIDPIYGSVSQLEILRPDLYVLNSHPVASNGVPELKSALADCVLGETYGFYELYECSWDRSSRHEPTLAGSAFPYSVVPVISREQR
jgi:hypothetical protein